MMVRPDAMSARQMHVTATTSMLRSQVPALRIAGRNVRGRLIEVVGVNLLLRVSLGHSKCQDEGEEYRFHHASTNCE